MTAETEARPCLRTSEPALQLELEGVPGGAEEIAVILVVGAEAERVGEREVASQAERGAVALGGREREAEHRAADEIGVAQAHGTAVVEVVIVLDAEARREHAPRREHGVAAA